MTGWRRPDAYIDFLRARMTEEAAEAAPQSRTTYGASAELRLAVRSLWLTVLLELRRTPLRSLAEGALKRMASRYDNHPDYSEWWRP